MVEPGVPSCTLAGTQGGGWRRPRPDDKQCWQRWQRRQRRHDPGATATRAHAFPRGERDDEVTKELTAKSTQWYRRVLGCSVWIACGAVKAIWTDGHRPTIGTTS